MHNSKRIAVRELRSKLKEHLNSGNAVAIGGLYDLRAILVSIPAHDRWNGGAKRKALAAAKKSFRAALDAERE